MAENTINFQEIDLTTHYVNGITDNTIFWGGINFFDALIRRYKLRVEADSGIVESVSCIR